MRQSDVNIRICHNTLLHDLVSNRFASIIFVRFLWKICCLATVAMLGGVSLGYTLENVLNVVMTHLSKVLYLLARNEKFLHRSPRLIPCFHIFLFSILLKADGPLERGHDQDRLRKQIMPFRHSVRGQV